ncbi:hypothetical protein T492DRAFT_835866 [Pavlovales sp. CCMP2436]|nr:hypothetical protein T492DRAFT_835866 [Pavlovales sp. CCMP2436]
MGRWQRLLLRVRSNAGPKHETHALERDTQSETVTFIVTMLYRQARFSNLGTGLLLVLLVIAVVQAPLVTVAMGSTLEFEQTISASVSDWGRFFFASCTFAAIVHLITMHPYMVSPPFTDDFSSPLGWLLDVLDGCLPCCRPASYFAPAAWPLSRHGALRFLWLTAQSVGLYLLASVNYTTEDIRFESNGEIRKRAIQHGLHNFGAALAFILSFVAEALVLSTTPRSKHVGRKVCLSLGILCAFVFLITQEGFGCTGRVPATICPAPFGTVSYMFECGMALSLAAIFFLTAFEHK